MKGKSLKVWAMTILALTLVLAANSALAKGGLHSDFEKGQLKPWYAGGSSSDATDQVVAIATGDDACATGEAFADLKFRHSGDNQGAWIVAPLDGTVAGIDLVRIDWSAKNVLNCEGCTPMVYVGDTEPTNISQFTKANASPNDPPAYGDWIAYHYPAINADEKPVKNNGTIYVALGFAAPDSKVKQVNAVGFDCVDILVFPAP